MIAGIQAALYLTNTMSESGDCFGFPMLSQNILFNSYHNFDNISRL